MRDDLRSRSWLPAFLGDPSPKNARRLTDWELGNAKEPRSVARDTGIITVIELEAQRRVAWRGPARWSLFISVIALLVSMIALYATLTR